MTILDKLIGNLCEPDAVSAAYAELNALRQVAEREGRYRAALSEAVLRLAKESLDPSTPAEVILGAASEIANELYERHRLPVLGSTPLKGGGA